MMYYWTLETVASDLYISQYENIEQELSLSSLQKKVYRWVKEASEFHFPVHLYVNPCVGVYFSVYVGGEEEYFVDLKLLDRR